MSDVKTEVVNEVKDNVVVVAEAKETFGTKIKNGAKKVFSSKPAKIVGGVLLAAGGAVVGYSFANSKNGEADYDMDDYDMDFDDEAPVEDESAIAD